MRLSRVLRAQANGARAKRAIDGILRGDRKPKSTEPRTVENSEKTRRISSREARSLVLAQVRRSRVFLADSFNFSLNNRSRSVITHELFSICRLFVTRKPRYVVAEVSHFENGPVITVSSGEWALKKQLYRYNLTR